MNETKSGEEAEKWLTPSQVANRLSVSVTATTVRSWAHKGLLPGAWRTPSGRWQIPVEAIDAISGGAA